MYQIRFYRTRNGKEPVAEYIQQLAKQKSKDARIKLNKIRDYVKALSLYGTQLGEPYLKHLGGELWELRPLRDRIFFIAWYDNTYILLHQFTKKSQRTPLREIEKANREIADLKERSNAHV